jgi:hypothetical protein
MNLVGEPGTSAAPERKPVAAWAFWTAVTSMFLVVHAPVDRLVKWGVPTELIALGLRTLLFYGGLGVVAIALVRSSRGLADVCERLSRNALLAPCWRCSCSPSSARWCFPTALPMG